jgi:DNA repair protein RadC
MPAVELIGDLPQGERPRERLLEQGSASLSEAELIAVLLRTGTAGKSALAMASELLREFGGLSGIASRTFHEIRRPGLGRAKAATLLAGIELGRRLARAQIPERRPMSRPGDVVSYLALRYGLRDQEIMGALFVDARNRLLGERELYRGTLCRTVVEPREVLKEGLLRGAAGVVLFHTHPSGDPSPSSEDVLFTRRMAEAGEVVGVRLLDHLILGHGGTWESLKERGAW